MLHIVRIQACREMCENLGVETGPVAKLDRLYLVTNLPLYLRILKMSHLGEFNSVPSAGHSAPKPRKITRLNFIRSI